MQGFPAVRPELDLVEQEDQLTHEFDIDDEIDQEIGLGKIWIANLSFFPHFPYLFEFHCSHFSPYLLKNNFPFFSYHFFFVFWQTL